MTLNTIFCKPIGRPIEGVIKADDLSSLRLEIEEYVLTNEVAKRLELFLDAYNNYQNVNGVWVSGFFGSGKSHLLKMLSLLLENRQIDGVPSLELILPKCKDNEILIGDIKRAVGIPSKSILFNLGQIMQNDDLLAAFVRCFDEACGYYGMQGHIAQFERDLDNRGLFEEFKISYESIAGKKWESGREEALFESNNINKAYEMVTNVEQASAVCILDKYRSQYRMSIGDFAEQVKAYIDKQSPNFRLNFFVDEVGQYIAENVKLMTNLQTIAESLATKCRGRSWIIVTSQEDMATVVGEKGKQQSNDFSKIQARFDKRLKLTSTDVAEVIQKRLLMKNEQGTGMLSEIYDSQMNNFKTLFDFADGSQSFRNFLDSEHFIKSYPFIPYQFSLFQSAIQSLSQHNAFEGIHSSVGERSMLGVFQQVVININDQGIGKLATFDQMYEGIRTALKSNIQRAIIQAEEHLNNPFAVQLLKALFLVKYVKEFKPTIRNLRILMQDNFSQEIPLLQKKIEGALNLLEQQTFVQRNGELYEYLTDEEKDVEQEIKNTQVESKAANSLIEDILFNHILKQKKIRYENNDKKKGGQDFPFARKLDDQLLTREYELAIHFITPFHENFENEKILVSQTLGRDELMVLLPSDDRIMRDVLTYKMTEKYIKQNVSIIQKDTVKRILSDKGYQNQKRLEDLKLRFQTLVGNARLFIGGSEIEIRSENPQNRIISGFHQLISRVYPNLEILRGVVYHEDDISKYLKCSIENSLESDATWLAESENEVLAFIQNNSQKGLRTTLKLLLERFECKPYGWSYPAVLCTLAKLFARGKIEAKIDSNILEDDELEQALKNHRGYGNVILEHHIEYTSSQVRILKNFYERFFDAPPEASEAKSLGKEISEKFKDLEVDLKKFESQTSQYAFLKSLEPVCKNIQELSRKSYDWYFSELNSQKETLLQIKESIIDPIKKFMNGSQRNIFDDAKKLLQEHESNIRYIEGGEVELIKGYLDDPHCFKSNQMPQVKKLVHDLQDKVDQQIKAEIESIKESVTELQKRISAMQEYDLLADETKNQITQTFDEFLTSIEHNKLIAVIRDSLNIFKDSVYPKLLSQMTNSRHSDVGQPREIETDEKSDEQASNIDHKVQQVPDVEWISCRSVNVTFEKAWLADESDVDSYLQSLREALLLEIKKGKRINI